MHQAPPKKHIPMRIARGHARKGVAAPLVPATGKLGEPGERIERAVEQPIETWETTDESRRVKSL